MKDYYTPDRTVEFLQNCERAGITTTSSPTPTRVAYVRPLRERGSNMSFFCLDSQRERKSRMRSSARNPSQWFITAA